MSKHFGIVVWKETPFIWKKNYLYLFTLIYIKKYPKYEKNRYEKSTIKNPRSESICLLPETLV